MKEKWAENLDYVLIRTDFIQIWDWEYVERKKVISIDVNCTFNLILEE